MNPKRRQKMKMHGYSVLALFGAAFAPAWARALRLPNRRIWAAWWYEQSTKEKRNQPTALRFARVPNR
jgi:hypothetical protein